MGLKEIYSRLNLTPENGLCILKEGQWKGKLPKRLEYLIEEKLFEPDAFFCFDKKPLILFYNSPQNRSELFKAIWNFNESPIVIINEHDTVEIFNGFSYLKNKFVLDKLEDNKNLKNFSYFELVTGKSLEQYQTKLKQQSRVDFYLLKNIRAARNILIDDHNIKNSLANALIGKCIFVRYLIDRGVKIQINGPLRKWTNNEFCKLFDNKTELINFFEYLKEKFNGEAFLLNHDELQSIDKKVFVVLQNLLKGTQLSSGQQSLFDIYDFSIIPVEFISNVYEHFIGKENQAEKGAYYTPKFLVDYILAETVEKYFQDNPKEYNCKTLDPSCGSGIFLVETLRRIVERYKELNNNKITKRVLKQLAEDNIFGIDKDKNAINVAIFSVYLSLLDYQEPKDIETFKFPHLIKNGNFHIADFFDTSSEYNKSFNKINFTFIIGNPPWKRGASEDNLFLKYIEERKQKEKKEETEICISNKEIAQAFLLRSSDFSGEKTKCALIINSKTLYNLNAKKFRKYFLYNFFIDKVFELAPVRKEVFDKSNDKAIAPAAIVFFRYSYGKNTASNELTHLCLKPNRLFSLFKIFVLQRPDIKSVLQKRLMKNDWLWKVLVYGNYLDFNFIKRLKKGYKSIADIVVDKGNLLGGQGVMVGGGDENDATHLIGLPLLNTRKDVKQFYVNSNLHNKWSLELAHRPKDKKLFTAPVLIIKGGINNQFESISAISYVDSVFKSSLTGIKLGSKDLSILRILSGLLNSELFSYNILNTGSSAGIEREESEDEEKWGLPFIKNIKIADIVKHIEDISKHIDEEKQILLNSKVSSLEIAKQETIEALNNEIFKSFNLNKQEIALVDYAVNVTIPLIMRHRGYKHKLFSPIPFRDVLLEEYVNIYILRFKNSLKGKYIKAQIWHTNNIIGIFFKVVPNNTSDKQIIEWQEKKNQDLLNKMASLGTQKITEKLFIQKDIRGFEKNGFYIIKPNEKKLWHKAIAYLDVDEFMNAILKAGKEVYHG